MATYQWNVKFNELNSAINDYYRIQLDDLNRSQRQAFNAAQFQQFIIQQTGRSYPKPSLSLKDLSKAEIEKELDIMRGITPTPKGYIIDRDRAKELMKELRKRA